MINEQLNTLDKVNEFINEQQLALLYVTMPQCSVCDGLRPQIKTLIEKYPHIHFGEVDASHVEKIKGQFSIFTAPVVILFLNGKEYLREARIIHTRLLEEKINRIYDHVVD